MNITLKSLFLSGEIHSCPILRFLSPSPGTRGVCCWACRGASLAAAASSDPSLGNVLWCLSDGEIIYCAQLELPSHRHRGCGRKWNFKTTSVLLCSAKAADFQLTQWACHLYTHVGFFFSFLLLLGIKYLIILKDSFQISRWVRRHQSNYGHLLAVIWTWSACWEEHERI